jgi:hypothetical protein
MSRKFWQIKNMFLEGTALRVAMVELTSNPNDIATSVTIAGITARGYPLEERANSERVTITFSKVTEFRVVPEQCSWPAYDDGKELISCLLYEKPGLFFYEKIALIAMRFSIAVLAGLVRKACSAISSTVNHLTSMFFQANHHLPISPHRVSRAKDKIILRELNSIREAYGK